MQEIKFREIPEIETLLKEGISKIKAERIINNLRLQNEMLKKIANNKED